jgi:hypothetical protein
MASGNAKKLADLADRLIERTKEGTISWSETDVPGRFAMTLGRSSMVIDDVGRTQFRLQVLDDRGNVLESHTATSDDVFVADPVDLRLNLSLPSLHDLVRRRVLKVDETLDALLDDL